MSEEKDFSKQLEVAMAQLDRQFGKGSVMRLTDDPQPWPAFSTGAYSLDVALGIGGLPRGRIVEIYGPESCLNANTFIQYEIKTKDGKRQNHKGGTIENLYRRFHNLPRSGSGSYQRLETVNSIFTASCMNEEGRIFQNRIIDVVDTGVKECFRIETENGEYIEATEDHKFFTGSEFKRLGDLRVGDTVIIHNNTPFKSSNPPKAINRKEVYVKHHPVAKEKVVAGRYTYKRLYEYRAVVEAFMNGLEYDQYIDCLNSGNIDGLEFLSSDDHVHHIDENCLNNDITNLAVFKAGEHGYLHSMNRHNNLRFTVVENKISSIKRIGNTQTYDIKMSSPFNNYIANNFVVHNSGKSTLCLSVIAEAQREGEQCLFIDAEHSLDPVYAGALGVKLEDLLLAQPMNGEEAIDILETMVRSGGVAVAVVDSVAALVPKAELEGDMDTQHMGLQPRLMSKAVRKLYALAAETKTLIIFTNQIREKIGVMFGNPETQPGGRALKFGASVRIDLRRKEDIKRKEDGRVVGVRVKAKVIKNKMAPPLRITEFDILYGRGVNTLRCVLDLAEEFNIVTKAGGGWYSYGEEKLGQGAEKAVEALASDMDMTNRIKKEIEAHV